MATNTKKTPAYVDKAIKWLEKNAPDNEQIAFISDEEAALLKARGGSGEEVVHGVRSYSDIEQLIRENRAREETQANQDFITQLREAAQAAEAAEEGGGTESEDPPPYSPPGGAGEIQRAREQASSLDQPALPEIPQLQTTPLEVRQDQLVDPANFRVSADPTLQGTEQISEAGLTTAVPTQFTPATTQAATVADTGQATAAQLTAPTRTIADIQGAVPTEELAQAATADLDPRATVQFQLGEITSSIRDGQPLPLWAAPAARSADSMMLQRGLGASSMAASARTQALIEAGLPIASADAQSYGRIQLQNLTHKQSAALQNANTLSAMRTQNLNNRMTAAVNNAQNFLTIDTANLNNQQASNTITFQANQQKLFTNQAAENAASQFNATSTNQVEQFFSTLDSSVTQANANRLTAIRQFNAGETNAFNQFITNQELAREQFNANQLASIRAANANWFRSVATINNGNQMAANSFAAQATLGLREREYNNLWQKGRDDASYIFSSTEAGLDRIAAEAALAQQAAIARGQQSASRSGSIFGAIGSVIGGLFASDIRLKTNIEKIGELNPAVDLYRWEWNEVADKIGVSHYPTVGVLAQEFIEYSPDLVMMHDDGYFRVNYSRLLG